MRKARKEQSGREQAQREGVPDKNKRRAGGSGQEGVSSGAQRDADATLGEPYRLSACSSGPDSTTYESANKYVSAIYRHLQIAIADELAAYKIGSGQYIFLLTIAEKQGMTQKALSEELLIDKTTTAKAISKLEAEGYVKRVASREDQRCNQLYLTEEGSAVVPKVKERLRKLMSIGRQGISDAEYELLIDLLKRVLNNVHAIVNNKGGV